MQTWVLQIALFTGFPNIPHIPPPYGTHSGHKSGNNDNDHRKPTELAHSVPSPRDMYSVYSLATMFMPATHVPIEIRTLVGALIHP